MLHHYFQFQCVYGVTRSSRTSHNFNDFCNNNVSVQNSLYWKRLHIWMLALWFTPSEISDFLLFCFFGVFFPIIFIFRGHSHRLKTGCLWMGPWSLHLMEKLAKAILLRLRDLIAFPRERCFALVGCYLHMTSFSHLSMAW